MKTGKAPRLPEKDDAYNSGYVDAMRDFTAHVPAEHRRGALRYIPNVLVSVNVDLDTTASDTRTGTQVRRQAVSLQDLEETENEESNESGAGERTGNEGQPAPEPAPAGHQQEFAHCREEPDGDRQRPRSLARRSTEQVAVIPPNRCKSPWLIPKDYYRDVAREARALTKPTRPHFQAKVWPLQTENEKEIKEKIARLIPSAGQRNCQPTPFTSARMNRSRRTKPPCAAVDDCPGQRSGHAMGRPRRAGALCAVGFVDAQPQHKRTNEATPGAGQQAAGEERRRVDNCRRRDDELLPRTDKTRQIADPGEGQPRNGRHGDQPLADAAEVSGGYVNEKISHGWNTDETRIRKLNRFVESVYEFNP